MSSTGPIDCGLCGIALGTGIPGGTKYCRRCADYVVTKARAGSSDALGGLIVLGAAFAVGAVAVAVLQGIFSGE